MGLERLGEIEQAGGGRVEWIDVMSMDPSRATSEQELDAVESAGGTGESMVIQQATRKLEYI